MVSTRFLGSATVAVTLALGAASAAHLWAHPQAAPTPQTPVGQTQAGRGGMGQMTAERQKMQADMAAQEKRLDELVTQMNAARGAEKIDKVAAALTELVSQHKAMHRRMMGPGGMMMQRSDAGGMSVPPIQGREATPASPQAHDQHTEHRDEEMCVPPV
jgi:hypothetical protein